MNNIPNFFTKELYSNYGEINAEKIMAGLVKKKTSFRVNNLLSNNKEIELLLQKENIRYNKVSWYDNAYVLNESSEKDLIEKDYYKDGKIYVQNLSSMIPPIVLMPKSEEDILDMCAAPGGKTTEIASLANNSAHITACEMNQIRIKKLEYNIKMQGASAYIMQKDARNLDNFLKFDKILLDSPCSGSGTLDSTNNNNEKFFTEYLVEKSIKSQKVLLNKAINLVKKGGEIVYSTCSILKCENEDIVMDALKRGNVEIAPIDKERFVDIPLLETTINGAMCVMPTDMYEGFFIAKLKKLR